MHGAELGIVRRINPAVTFELVCQMRALTRHHPPGEILVVKRMETFEEPAERPTGTGADKPVLCCAPVTRGVDPVINALAFIDNVHARRVRPTTVITLGTARIV